MRNRVLATLGLIGALCASPAEAQSTCGDPRVQRELLDAASAASRRFYEGLVADPGWAAFPVEFLQKVEGTFGHADFPFSLRRFIGNRVGDNLTLCQANLTVQLPSAGPQTVEVRYLVSVTDTGEPAIRPVNDLDGLLQIAGLFWTEFNALLEANREQIRQHVTEREARIRAEDEARARAANEKSRRQLEEERFNRELAEERRRREQEEARERGQAAREAQWAEAARQREAQEAQRNRAHQRGARPYRADPPGSLPEVTRQYLNPFSPLR